MYRLTILALLFIVSLSAPAAAEQSAETGELRITFIGNSSFKVDDGEFILATDFPYRSGSQGYMKYDYEAVKPRGIVVALFTHGHPDHWDFSHFIKDSYAIIGPRTVVRGIRGFEKIEVTGEDPIEWETIRVEPRATHHVGMEHFSYLVTWHGVRMFFSGDIEDTAYILRETDLDVAFVTPWLLAALELKEETVDADRIIVHHHYRGERVTEYADRVVPEQGDTFVIPFKE